VLLGKPQSITGPSSTVKGNRALELVGRWSASHEGAPSPASFAARSAPTSSRKPRFLRGAIVDARSPGSNGYVQSYILILQNIQEKG